jgi:hypothetical protein
LLLANIGLAQDQPPTEVDNGLSLSFATPWQLAFQSPGLLRPDNGPHAATTQHISAKIAILPVREEEVQA